jgi:hypothetical protein
VQVITPPMADTGFRAGLPVSNLPAGAVMKPHDLVDAALKGLDRANRGYSPRCPIRPVWTRTRRRARRSSEA